MKSKSVAPMAVPRPAAASLGLLFFQRRKATRRGWTRSPLWSSRRPRAGAAVFGRGMRPPLFGGVLGLGPAQLAQLGQYAGLLLGLGFLPRRFGPRRRHDLDVGLRSKPRRHGGLGRGQQRAAFFARLLLVLLFAFQAPRCLLDLVVEIDLGAKPQGYGVLRGQIGGIPMRAIADGGNRRLGRADQPHDLTVLQFRVIAQQPNDGIWPVLTARNGGVARSLLGLDLGDFHFRG